VYESDTNRFASGVGARVTLKVEKRKGLEGLRLRFKQGGIGVADGGGEREMQSYRIKTCSGSQPASTESVKVGKKRCLAKPSTGDSEEAKDLTTRQIRERGVRVSIYKTGRTQRDFAPASRENSKGLHGPESGAASFCAFTRRTGGKGGSSLQRRSCDPSREESTLNEG